jgi:hypothetical protein
MFPKLFFSSAQSNKDARVRKWCHCPETKGNQFSLLEYFRQCHRQVLGDCCSDEYTFQAGYVGHTETYV